MGMGSWSASTYDSTTRAKVTSGTNFGYSNTTRSKSYSDWKAHEDLDPSKKNSDGSLVRESRDSDEHPNALPIAVFFDDTGSMGQIPYTVQTKLANLFGLLLRKGYAEDPQVMVGCYGDAYVDRVPLQVSQFESDNRIDDNLDNLFIERGGGGNGGETMSMAWYFLANFTSTDAYEKRGKKGYAFFIADETALDLTPEHITQFVGVDEAPVKANLTASALATAVQEKWDVYILLVDNLSAKMQGSQAHYEKMFGKNHVLIVEDPDAITETIALAIGALEGTVDIEDEGAKDLKDTGSSDVAIRSAVATTTHLSKLSTGFPVVKGEDFEF